MCPRVTTSSTKKTPPLEVGDEAIASAKEAGLRYVYDSGPGISRRRWRGGFRYIGSDGAMVRDKEVLARIKSLVIPPAWEQVWICGSAHGHLQATGRDAKGRKQSRYHPRWRAVRDEAKYEHMMRFGESLSQIRKQVEHDLALPGLPREKVLATIVRLMETTFIRVGNEEYARENKSYGLTTMRRKHVTVAGAKVSFSFKGKSGVDHSIDVNDSRLAKIVKRCQDIPGYELFQYLDAEGERHTVDSADVNEYLCGMTGEHFTAKDFRTWAGTVLTCVMLREFESFATDREAKKNVVQAIASVAKQLGNTPSVCRKCYVHPAVLECYLSGTMVTRSKRLEAKSKNGLSLGLRREESALMMLLQQQLALAKAG